VDAHHEGWDGLNGKNKVEEFVCLPPDVILLETSGFLM